MSSTLATDERSTRTPRLTPPAEPTRTARPRRRTLGQGASLVGRSDRPVLRIVADHESAPVFTRVEPASPSSVEPAGAPSWVELATPSLVEPASAASGVETPVRRVDLQDFFAPEYDGDDVSVEVDTDRDLVAAGRIDVVHLGVERVLQTAMLRVLVVIENDLLVHRVERHTHVNISFTLEMPATSASISSSVV